MRIKEIVSITNGKLIQGDEDYFTKGVSTDTRTIKKGELFIALKGDKFDGNSFVNAALKKGAGAILTSRNLKVPKYIPVIKVKDTLIALGKIAAFYRRDFDIPIIAITGSAGKTTTKEMVAAVLSGKYKVLKNAGTNNNKIGVPLTLLKLSNKYDVAVLELGTNHPGEIKYLTKMVNPDVSILTNVGESHLKGLKTVKGVLKEKLDIVKYTKKTGCIIYNKDNEYLASLSGLRIPQEKISYSCLKKAYVKADNIKLSEKNTLSFKIKGKKFSINTFAKHDIENALAAISCGLFFGLSYNNININIRKSAQLSGRQNINKVRGFTVINDTYNSNPVSLKSAISSLNILKTQGKKILVCADMLELGKYSDKLHAEIGKFIRNTDIDVVLSFGPKAQKIAAHLNKIRSSKVVKNFNDIFELNMFLIDILKPKDIVLVKGSRSMRMERTVNFIKKHSRSK